MIATIHRIEQGTAETPDEAESRRVALELSNKEYWAEHPDRPAKIFAEHEARQAARPTDDKEREATDHAEWRGKVADWEVSTRHPDTITRGFWYTHGGHMSSSYGLEAGETLEAACAAADAELRAKGWPIPEYESYVVVNTTERPGSPL